MSRWMGRSFARLPAGFHILSSPHSLALTPSSRPLPPPDSFIPTVSIDILSQGGKWSIVGWHICCVCCLGPSASPRKKAGMTTDGKAGLFGPTQTPIIDPKCSTAVRDMALWLLCGPSSWPRGRLTHSTAMPGISVLTSRRGRIRTLDSNNLNTFFPVRLCT